MNTARHSSSAGSLSAQIIPMHRGFALRTFHLDLVFASGARFVGRVQAITHAEAEDLAAAKVGEIPESILRSSSRPMPLDTSFDDTQLPLDDAAQHVRSALARADDALCRSEAVAGDDLTPADHAHAHDTGTTGADFDAYNAQHGVIGRLTGQHCTEASDADEDTFRAWMDRTARISAWQLYRQAHDAAWAHRGEAPAPAGAPGSALDDMATVLRHSRSAADEAGPATWPDVWVPGWGRAAELLQSVRRSLRPADYRRLAAAAVLAIGALVLMMGGR